MVRSETDPTIAFVGAPSVMTTVSSDSASSSAVMLRVAMPLVPSLITMASVAEVKSLADAVPPMVIGTVTG